MKTEYTNAPNPREQLPPTSLHFLKFPLFPNSSLRSDSKGLSLPKAPSSNMVSLGIKSLACELWGQGHSPTIAILCSLSVQLYSCPVSHLQPLHHPGGVPYLDYLLVDFGESFVHFSSSFFFFFYDTQDGTWAFTMSYNPSIFYKLFLEAGSP